MTSVDAGVVAPDPVAVQTAQPAAAAPDTPASDTSAAAPTTDTLEALSDPKKAPPPPPAKAKGDAHAIASGKKGEKPAPSTTATATATAPAAQPPECAVAARFCHHPSYATDESIRGMCATNKSACEAKGGHI